MPFAGTERGTTDSKQVIKKWIAKYAPHFPTPLHGEEIYAKLTALP